MISGNKFKLLQLVNYSSLLIYKTGNVLCKRFSFLQESINYFLIENIYRVDFFDFLSDSVSSPIQLFEKQTRLRGERVNHFFILQNSLQFILLFSEFFRIFKDCQVDGLCIFQSRQVILSILNFFVDSCFGTSFLVIEILNLLLGIRNICLRCLKILFTRRLSS